MEVESKLIEPTTVGALSYAKVPVREGGEHVYALAHSHDGKYLAAAFGNGCLRVFDAETFAAIQRAKAGSGFDDVPATGIAWRPPHEASEEGVYEIVVASSAGGILGFNFDASDPAAIYLDRVWKAVEEGNETAACDFSPDGALIVSAGSDRIVRLYDANTRKLVSKLDKGRDDAGHVRPAHTNRIFSAKFVSPHLILTGGWEAPVQVWDVRTGQSERQIVGPQISSDGIETTPNSQTIMTVSKRDNRQLQVYDFLSGRENERESQKLSANVGKNALVAVRFSPEGQCVWTATTKPDSLLCLDAANGEVKGQLEEGRLGTILCLERSRLHPKRVIVGAMKESIFVVDLA